MTNDSPALIHSTPDSMNDSNEPDDRSHLDPCDWSHLAQTYEASVDYCDRNGWEYEGEVVMTSIGYVDLYRDGDVGAFGRILGNCLDEDC